MLEDKIKNYLEEVRYLSCSITSMKLTPYLSKAVNSQFVNLHFHGGYIGYLRLKVGNLNVDYDLYLKLKNNLSKVVTIESENIGSAIAVTVCKELLAIGDGDNFILTDNLFGDIITKPELEDIISKVMKEKFEEIIGDLQNDVNLVIDNICQLSVIASEHANIDISTNQLCNMYNSLINVITTSKDLLKETH